jgi:putative transposase
LTRTAIVWFLSEVTKQPSRKDPNTMADELRIGLSELLRKAMIEQDAGFLKEGIRVLSQALMEMEVEEHVGAGRHERSPGRTGQRNGYRERNWDTRVGTVELAVPRVRDSSYFPSLLEPRRRAERALSAVVQEAYVHGISTRKVEELVKALGMEGISKSQVGRLCEELDSEVERFRGRPLEGPYPYVWVDATYVKARQDGRVVPVAVVIAVGVNGKTGEREILGLDVGPSEEGAFWISFLRSLVARGLWGVKLVTSDAHRGLKGAIEAVLQGASWQRCRVHFMRNALSLVPKAAQQMVGATIRTVFAQPDSQSARQQWLRVSDGFQHRFPRLSELMEEAEEDVLVYAAFPQEHWQKIWSNNPLERVNKELKRRTNVVGIFPNEAAVIRLVGAVLLEQHDEWQVSKRYCSLGSLAKLERKEELTEQPQLIAG